MSKKSKKMRRQSTSSKPLQTGEDNSVTTSQLPPEPPNEMENMQRLQTALSSPSEEQLTEAISLGKSLAIQDALSMLRRRTAKYQQTQLSKV